MVVFPSFVRVFVWIDYQIIAKVHYCICESIIPIGTKTATATKQNNGSIIDRVGKGAVANSTNLFVDPFGLLHVVGFSC